MLSTTEESSQQCYTGDNSDGGQERQEHACVMWCPASAGNLAAAELLYTNVDNGQDIRWKTMQEKVKHWSNVLLREQIDCSIVVKKFVT